MSLTEERKIQMERNMTVITVCPFCSSSRSVDVNSDDYIRWMDGVNAQDAFPYLDANEREAIISGICPTCWDKMIP